MGKGEGTRGPEGVRSPELLGSGCCQGASLSLGKGAHRLRRLTWKPLCHVPTHPLGPRLCKAKIQSGGGQGWGTC